ncbi:MAG: glutaredoxin family protein [Methanoregula sp.]|nr:glutaredoxin family protein [Methanoregula sp.]
MPDNSGLILYTLEHCPNCEMLNVFLKSNGKIFSERDMSTAESLTELRVNGIFTNEAPVLQKGDEFFTSDVIFSCGKLDTARIIGFISGA